MRHNISILLLILSTLCQAETYTIVFNSGNSDSTSKVQSLDQVVLTATDHCVQSMDLATNIYRAKDGYGIKGGTSSATGELTLRLDTTYHITSLTLYAAAFNNSEDIKTNKGMIVMGQTFTWNTNPTNIQAYTITLDTLTRVLHFKGKETKNRFYIQRLEFTADDPMPNHAKIDLTYQAFKFESMEYDEASPAEDAETFSVEAKGVTAAGLQLSMKRGTVFSVTPTTLPAEGGDFEISYTYSNIGYNLTDTVVVSGYGSDGLSVAHSFPVEVTIYKYTPKPVDSTGMVISVAPEANYYTSADGLQDSVLKSTLGAIINTGIRYRYGSGYNHTWAGFWYTDRDTTNNMVLDMYSNEEHYFSSERPTASVSGFDIEHMLPKSWWGRTVNAAYCDLFHLVPGNASANRSKSNHAPGIPNDTTFWNGSFATGNNEHGKVFCPADEYKGDFARAYFYIACCYGDLLTWVETAGSEPAEAMTNSDWHEFRPWLSALLLDWHRMDPVSEKEKARAIEVNRIQGNRNPFIDYPELVEYIWGNQQGTVVNLQQLTPTFTPEQPTILPNIDTLEKSIKLLRNGQLIIIRNGRNYTILGKEL